MSDEMQHGSHSMPYNTGSYATPYASTELVPEAASVGNWVLTLFVAGIPVVGFIMMLIWSFSSKTPAGKKNWARAQLIWTIVITIASVIVGIWLSNQIQSLLQ